MDNKEDLLSKLAQTMIDGDDKAAAETAQAIVAAGIDVQEAIKQGAIKGLDILGERFQRLEAFLPELIRAGDTMKACMAVFKPHIKPEHSTEMDLGDVVIGTVKGDAHDIGKNIVANMLAASGFEIHDLGFDVPVSRFVEEAEKNKAKIIALSSLLTQSSYYQKQVIDYLRDAGVRDKYFVIIGGAPVSPEWAIEIQADGYARTAVGATQIAKKLVTGGATPPLSQPIIINE
ncbi:B12-binding domain-containing protein [Chloroflexota bacterium]